MQPGYQVEKCRFDNAPLSQSGDVRFTGSDCCSRYSLDPRRVLTEGGDWSFWRHIRARFHAAVVCRFVDGYRDMRICLPTGFDFSM